MGFAGEGLPQAFGAPPAAIFSSKEEACYRHAFAHVDTEGTGRIGGLQAATFLSGSGLERKVLKQIWDIADSNGRGWLGPEQFSVALRLVAHAQAGRSVSAKLVSKEPVSLPQIEGLGSSGLAGTGSAHRRGRSPAHGEDRRAPTARDLRKYGREFCRLVQNRSPGLPAEEAKQLFNRSGLADNILAKIWDVADHDRDAHLSWPEFVLAMHLIRRALAGQSVYPSGSALPQELVSMLGSLESAQAYASQPSNSPRSQSGASGSLSPRPAPSLPFEETVTDPGLGFSSTFSGQAHALEKRRHGSPHPDIHMHAAGGGPPGSGKQKGSRNRGEINRQRVTDAPQAPASSSISAFTEEGSTRASYDQPAPSKPLRPGDRHSDGRWTGAEDTTIATDSQPVEHLEVLVESDKQLVRQLQRDIHELEEELAGLQQRCRQEDQEAAKERVECERVGQERQHLSQQLEAAQRQAAELRLEHQGLHVESVLLRRDTDIYSKEAAFAKRLFDESARDMQILQQSVAYLEESNKSLLTHKRSLEEARHEVLRQVLKEKGLLRKEKQETELVMQVIEALRSGGVDGLARLQSKQGFESAFEAGSGTATATQQARRSPGEPAPLWHAGGLFEDNFFEGASADGFASQVGMPSVAGRPLPAMSPEASHAGVPAARGLSGWPAEREGV